MKKILMFAFATCLFSSAVMASTPSSGTSDFEKPESKKRRIAMNTSASESDRTFHVMQLSKEENKYVLMIGRKPNTKVSVSVYDKNGALLYKVTRKANRDFAAVLNLEQVAGAVIKIADSNGVEKDYSF